MGLSLLQGGPGQGIGQGLEAMVHGTGVPVSLRTPIRPKALAAARERSPGRSSPCAPRQAARCGSLVGPRNRGGVGGSARGSSTPRAASRKRRDARNGRSIETSSRRYGSECKGITTSPARLRRCLRRGDAARAAATTGAAFRRPCGSADFTRSWSRPCRILPAADALLMAEKRSRGARRSGDLHQAARICRTTGAHKIDNAVGQAMLARRHGQEPG